MESYPAAPFGPASPHMLDRAGPCGLVRHCFIPIKFPGLAQPRTLSTLGGPGSIPSDCPLARVPLVWGCPLRRHRQGAPPAHLRPLALVFGSFGVFFERVQELILNRTADYTVKITFVDGACKADDFLLDSRGPAWRASFEKCSARLN